MPPKRSTSKSTKPQAPSGSSSTYKKSSSSSKSKGKLLGAGGQQKTKPVVATKKKDKRKYTDEELGIPKLNMITPSGVQKPRGKKKGKIFVDDVETMQTILALVNAEKEGEIESKMMRARQMEEIREARQREAEMRDDTKKQVLEGKKNELRKKRKRGNEEIPAVDVSRGNDAKGKPKRKTVSFG